MTGAPTAFEPQNSEMPRFNADGNASSESHEVVPTDEKKVVHVNDHDIENAPPLDQIEGHPQAEPHRLGTRVKAALHHRNVKVAWHFFMIAVLLGWWIPGIINKGTRHKWVITTVWTWFLIGLILFHNRYIPQRPFVIVISKVWNTLLGKPWSMLPYYGKIAAGWIALLALYFGSAYGIKETQESRYKDRTISLFGIFVINSCFYATSHKRSAVQVRQIVMGLGFQMIIALFVFKTGAGLDLFQWIAIAASDLLTQAQTGGATFFFSADVVSNHFFFVNTLASIIFFVALAQALFYVGVMQWIIKKFAWVFYKSFGISGAEAVVAAATPFIGQGENAVLVKPFVDHMTDSELHQILVSGFSTIAGSVFIAYVALGVNPRDLITASVMSIPASITASKLVYPETEEPVTAGRVVVDRGDSQDNTADVLHALSKGAWFGLRVAGLILCNVLVILSVLYTINGLLTWIGKFWSINELTLELIGGYILYPLVWLLGVPGADVLRVSKLLALKVIANEFVGYEQLQSIQTSADPLSDRAYLIAKYMLCGFGNVGSLGINIGVLSALAPSRGPAIARLAPGALIVGILTTCQTAAIAGLLA